MALGHDYQPLSFQDFHLVVIGNQQFDKALCIALGDGAGDRAIIRVTTL